MEERPLLLLRRDAAEVDLGFGQGRLEGRVVEDYGEMELPPPLNNCVVFFEYCVRHKVICVPGIFFDVNPFHRRRFHKSPYIDKLRMSYGPAWPNLKQAVKGMKEIIELAKAGQLPPLAEPPKA